MNKQTILEVQDYFKQKLINGEYEIKKVDEHVTEVLVDEDFQFNIWTANAPNWISVYKAEKNFMNIPEFSQEEKEAIWANLEKPVNEWKNGDLLAQKKAQFEQLRKELNIPA